MWRIPCPPSYGQNFSRVLIHDRFFFKKNHFFYNHSLRVCYSKSFYTRFLKSPPSGIIIPSQSKLFLFFIRYSWWLNFFYKQELVSLLFLFNTLREKRHDSSFKPLYFWDYVTFLNIMKYPSHIILDVNRPVKLKPSKHIQWHEFYKTHFIKNNSLHLDHSFKHKKTSTRITVTQQRLEELNLGDYKTLQSLKLTKKIPTTSNFVINTSARVIKYHLPLTDKWKSSSSNIFKNMILSHIAAQKARQEFFNTLWKPRHGSSFSINLPQDDSLKNQSFLALKLTKKNSYQNLSKPQNPSPVTVQMPVRIPTKNKHPKIPYRFCFINFSVDFRNQGVSLEQLQSGHFTKKHTSPQQSTLFSHFDIHFLLKEMHYSKLKYSKTAERDIVSSGSAALFAGFIGFLISEKFGIELVDSGDFYFAFMYAVFFGFSCKIFTMGLESSTDDWEASSKNREYTHRPHRWLGVFVNFFTYIVTIITLILRFIINDLPIRWDVFQVPLFFYQPLSSLRSFFSSFSQYLQKRK